MSYHKGPNTVMAAKAKPRGVSHVVTDVTARYVQYRRTMHSGVCGLADLSSQTFMVRIYLCESL
jgi:hypothetical protein